MFFHQVNNDVTPSVSIPQYADELFALTDQSRGFLKQWLPSFDTVATPSDTTDFILAQLARFQRGEGCTSPSSIGTGSRACWAIIGSTR
jgi:ribosomal-protein-serine acetyltransferase